MGGSERQAIGLDTLPIFVTLPLVAARKGHGSEVDPDHG